MVIAEETDIEAVEDWQQMVLIQALGLALLTALIVALATWFFHHLRRHEALEDGAARRQAACGVRKSREVGLSRQYEP